MAKCNKEESVRWKNIAERMMQENDFLLARKLIISVQNNFDDTEISKMLIVCDVQCSAERKLVGDVMNWYEIIQVDQTADEAAINKQFKKLARQLHTDKNRFPGADAAFKLVSEARRVLLDKKKRLLFDKKYKASLVKPATIFKEVVREEMAACSTSADANQPKEKISLTFSASCPFSDVWKKFIFKRAMGSQNCSKGFDAYDLDNTRSWQASKMKHTLFPQEPSASKKGFDSNGDFGAVQSKDDNVEKTLPTYEAGLKKSSGERKRKEVLESGKSSFTEKSSGKRKRKGMSEPIESSDSEIDANAGDDVIDDQYIDFLNRLKLGSAFEPIDEADDIKCESPLTKPATSHGRGSCCPSGSGDSNLINESKFANIAQAELPNGGSSTFLTVCPCCTTKTECHKSIMKRALRCQNCNKSFIAYDDCGHCKRKRNKDNNDKYFETGQNSGSKLLRRSGRLLEKFYNEIPDDGDDDQHGDVDEVVMISDDDDDDEEEEDYMLPRPDFNDFDKKRGEDCFRVNQIWALYDSLDTMPRFYALIKEVMFLPRSSIRITWLEAEPENESETKWVDEGLPIGCGRFKVGTSEDIEGFSKFSHLVSCKIEGDEDTCTIIPMKGEIWALFKDWNINWKFDTNPYGKYEYEIVEILSDYNEGGIGTSVAYLSKVNGFVSVFRRTVCDDGASTFLIPLSQRFRFAHRVFYFELNGEERGVLRGSFELDPASLPDSIVHADPYKDLKVVGAVKAFRPKSPCFSVKTTSILQQLCLEIPRSYLVSGAALPTTIFLRLSTGLVWQVKLSEEGKHVSFTDGWQEFVEYSALTVRHLVLFEHSESNVFNVRVLVNKDTEIEYPLDNVVDIKPQDTLSGDNGYNHDFTTHTSYAARESRGNTRMVQPKQAVLDETNDFKSDYKFFKITIWPSYTAQVGRRGGVGLPKSFVMEYIDKSEFIQMTLKVGEQSWNVLAHTRTGKKSSCQIRTGWAPFAKDNDLKLNDICFFEVTRKGNPAELTVSIFRAAGV